MLHFTKRTVDRLENIMNEQDMKGIEKYGKPLDPMDDYDWLDMAEEELADALKYFNAEREKRNSVLKSALRDLEYVKRAIEGGNYIGAHSVTHDAITRLEKLTKKR